MKTFLITCAALLMLVVFVGTAYYLYQKSEEPPVIFPIEAPFTTTIIKKSVASGSINPRKEILVKPQVSGIIEKVYVRAGAIVRQGDLLAKIRIIPDLVQLNNAQAALAKANISLDEAQKEKERVQKLFDGGFAAAAELVRARATLDRAREEVRQEELNVRLIKEGAARNDEQSTNFARATSGGMLLDVPVKEGGFVIESNAFNEGTTIASIADMNAMIFEGTIDESEVGKIRTGMEIELAVGAIENTTFPAALEFISPKGKEVRGSIQFEIRAAVTLNDDDFIRAGYSANASIILDRRDSVLAVKESVVRFRNDSAFVDVQMSPQVFEERLVQLGLSDGVNVEIIAGIALSDSLKGLRYKE